MAPPWAIGIWNWSDPAPLRVIRAEEDYERAIDTLNQLSDRGEDRTTDETEYLLALAVFVEKYEDEHDPIAQASGVEMLRAPIESRQITRSDIAAGAGLAVSTVSDLLAGKMSLEQIERLARFFEVKPSFFLDERFRGCRKLMPVHISIAGNLN